MDEDKRYWFPAKRYGWGWGMPNTWQGKWVMVAYMIALMAGAMVIDPVHAPLGYAGFVALQTVVLLVICYRTGEPPRWRWGDDGKKK